ncbi:MAG: class I SAM-dependent methyltransferase [Candidatus Magasanikbacteria bacterium]|nr:class I SAM-dependent methyltransferase [Candidatus Magasanikbacteria bacterium]
MYRSGTYLLDPHFILEESHTREGMRVADFGCGRTGHFTFPISQKVGDKGCVYAVDILKDVLHNVESRKRGKGLKNIHTVWADIEKLGAVTIPKNSLDIVFIVNTLSQSSFKADILNEASRLMKNKSRLVIVDWHRGSHKFGVSQDLLVNFSELGDWGVENNFVVQDSIVAGPHHAGIILYKHE